MAQGGLKRLHAVRIDPRGRAEACGRQAGARLAPHPGAAQRERAGCVLEMSNLPPHSESGKASDLCKYCDRDPDVAEGGLVLLRDHGGPRWLGAVRAGSEGGGFGDCRGGEGDGTD